MDTHYRDLVGMGYDEYLAYMEKSMPSTIVSLLTTILLFCETFK